MLLLLGSKIYTFSMSDSPNVWIFITSTSHIGKLLVSHEFGVNFKEIKFSNIYVTKRIVQSADTVRPMIKQIKTVTTETDSPLQNVIRFSKIEGIGQKTFLKLKIFTDLQNDVAIDPDWKIYFGSRSTHSKNFTIQFLSLSSVQHCWLHNKLNLTLKCH